MHLVGSEGVVAVDRTLGAFRVPANVVVPGDHSPLVRLACREEEDGGRTIENDPISHGRLTGGEQAVCSGLDVWVALVIRTSGDLANWPSGEGLREVDRQVAAASISELAPRVAKATRRCASLVIPVPSHSLMLGVTSDTSREPRWAERRSW